MTDFLIQATLSNLFVATILAVTAWLVQRRVRSASLANLMWALVLIKMVTPPLFSLPVFEVPSFASFNAVATAAPSETISQVDVNQGLRQLTFRNRNRFWRTAFCAGCCRGAKHCFRQRYANRLRLRSFHGSYLVQFSWLFRHFESSVSTCYSKQIRGWIPN